MSQRTDKKKRDRAKRKALKLAKMKAAGGRSAYARKVAGDYPTNSPYRGRWAEFRPDGGRASRRINAQFRIR